VICANQAPDHTTIARFRQRHETALAGLFGEVLALCAQAGLVRVGVIAVDGTKLAANASQQATRDFEQIAREILAEADELPAEMSTAQGRRGWLREANRRLDDSGRPRPGRSRATGPTGCARPSGGWRKSTRPSAAPTPPTRPIAPGGG